VTLKDTHGKTQSELEAHRREIEEHKTRHLQSRDENRSLQSERDNAHTKIKKLEDEIESVREDRRKVGEAHSNDKFSLESEIEKFKRDLGRLEDEMDRAGNELDMRDEMLRQKEKEMGDLVCRFDI